MDFESPFHVQNRRLISGASVDYSSAQERLSHKDNAVTTQGSYQCGIHTFSSKMAAHEIRRDLRVGESSLAAAARSSLFKGGLSQSFLVD